VDEAELGKCEGEAHLIVGEPSLVRLRLRVRVRVRVRVGVS